MSVRWFRFGLNRCNVLFFVVLFLFADACAGGQNNMKAEQLAKRIRQVAGRIVPTAAVLPGYEDKTFLELEKEAVLQFSPGVGGVYELNATFLVHHKYIEPQVQFEGKDVKPEISRNGKIVRYRFPSLAVTGSGADLSLRIPQGKMCALISLDWTIHRKNFQPVADSLWKKLPDGSAETWFHSVSQWTNYEFELSADGAVELFLHGKSVGKADAGKKLRHTVLWYRMNRESCCSSVKVKKAPGTRFILRTSPLGGATFYRELPVFLDLDRPGRQTWNKTVLENGALRIEVADTDFYRGARFERAGIVTSVRYKGSEYFAANFKPGERNPYRHDHVAGNAEEFFEPIGFSDGRSGQPFIKIGNGLFEKPDMKTSFFSISYQLVRSLPWEVARLKNKLIFTQELMPENGYAYVYVKTIELIGNQPTLKITYMLKNTGSKMIRSTQYAHNFLLIDGKPISNDYKLSYKDRISLLRFKPGDVVWKENTLRLHADKRVSLDVEGITAAAKNELRIEQLSTGKGIILKEDFVPYKHTLFISHAICPESFKLIDLAPGESDSWSRTYTFF